MKRVSSTTTCTFFRIDTEAFEHSQGGHSPDHMKFPDFSLTFPVQAGKDYRHTV